jgi:hypothetical protein
MTFFGADRQLIELDKLIIEKLFKKGRCYGIGE